MRSALFGLNVEESSDLRGFVLFIYIFLYFLAFGFVVIGCNFGSDSRGWNEWAVEKNTEIPAGSAGPVSHRQT